MVFNRSRGFSDKPELLPCGKCMGCRLERSRQWALRCMCEASLHDENCFLTLTYDDAHLPRDYSLSKIELQKFLKRLRKSLDVPIRYYACGEYGEQLSRPHYHLIIFGYRFTDLVPMLNNNGQVSYASESLTKLWPFGFSTVGSVTFESAAYVARYCTKKINGDLADSHYSLNLGSHIVKLKPEFSIMSLKPAIGLPWLKLYHQDVYPSGFMVSRGLKVQPPKYFDKILERDNLPMFKRIKSIRRRAAQIASDNSTLVRLAVRQAVKSSRVSLLHRPLESLS